MTRDPMPQAIRVEDMTLSYRHRPALRRLNCEFQAGSLTAIVGPNGAGKSSLLQALAGLITPTSGSLHRPPIHASAIAYLDAINRAGLMTGKLDYHTAAQ